MLQSQWVLDRTEVKASGGMVAAKTPQAARAGAEVLRQGGNAVDAAVVTALVAAVAEPWMNGIGGGGFLVRYDSRDGDRSVVEYPMAAPAAAAPEMFPLSGAGPDAALFGWPGVVDNANIVGHRAVAVPGTVAGLALALETYGTLSFSNALEPAIVHAEEGVPVTWHTTLEIARDLANLKRFASTSAIFCDAGGNPPYTTDEANPLKMVQSDLAKTLKTLADEGPEAFYHGDLAGKIVAHLAEGGAPFQLSDFATYKATVSTGISNRYGEAELLTTGGGSGGPTLAASMSLLDRTGLSELPHNSVEALHLMAQAFRMAFCDRFAYLADVAQQEVPLEALLSDAYLDARAAEITSGPAGRITAGDRSLLGVRHNLPGSVPEYSSGGSTTHLSVIDRDGVAVSLTQTLLSLWGSRVTIPGTGILMNNGMMWFDPVPGRPNSVAGGKRPLSNMSPAILIRDGQAVAALGASGGRRIMNCLAQIAMNMVDHGMLMQAAVNAPRIDASTPALFVSSEFPGETVAALTALGHQVRTKHEDLFLGEFSSPACVQRQETDFWGGVDPHYYPATACGVAT